MAEKLEAEVGSTVTFDDVLLVGKAGQGITRPGSICALPESICALPDT